MNVAAYLKRLEFNESVKPDAQTLRRLQSIHMQRVPFENLDIGMKHPIHINEKAIWDKLITNKRGGFCYELNGLFAWLLKQIGFGVTYLNACVFSRDGSLGIDFDHLALLVQFPNLSERWLADVGFGDSFIEPLSLENQNEQTQGLRAYRIEQSLPGYIVWQRNYDETWERQYLFDLTPHKFPEEYESACLYHQTSPKSGFTRNGIISRATPEGRVSLEDRKLILTIHGQRKERPLTSNEEYVMLLRKYFDVEL